MPKINQILVDMDGVLCDFFGAALKLWNLDPDHYPPNQWEIADVAGVSVDEFWERIRSVPNFWANLQPYLWTESLIQLIESFDVPWCVATAPGLDAQCASQKVQWMHRHLRDGFHDFMIGQRKELMARNDAVLIDDNDRNCSKFFAAGGTAILFPQRWNSGYKVANPFEDVKRKLLAAMSGV